MTPAPFWSDLFGSLQSSAFHDVAGTRMSARVPISRNLLNRLVRSTVAASPHVRDVDIRPHAGDAFDVLITLSWPFVPAIKVAVIIERQPQFPASPAVVLRWSLFGAAGVIASRFIAWLDRLPAGARLDGDRLVLDIRRLAEGTTAASVLPYIRSLAFHTIDDRVVVEVDMEIES
ncbi:MAG TPA: hypothetical protein VGJ39_01700 [Vicinamibacterales bacterium]